MLSVSPAKIAAVASCEQVRVLTIALIKKMTGRPGMKVCTF
jgi:hypothetical protein